MLDKIYEHKLVDVDSLIPYANNARTHSQEQVSQLAASMREFGFTQPVLVDENNTLIAGHGRLLAAQKLKLEKLPAIVVDGLSEAQRKALILADNKLPLNAGWDDDMLKLELEALQDLDFELDVVGFDADELNVLFNGWQSDVELPELKEVPTDTKIAVTVDIGNREFAKEVITNALDGAGIEYQFA